MLRNYLKIAFRNLQKNKMHAVINISGLAIGLSVTMLIGLWIWDELSYNSSFPNHKQLAQVLITQSDHGEFYTDETVAMPIGGALREQSNLFKRVSLNSWNGDHVLSVGDKKLVHSGRWAEPDFVNMFTPVLVEGDARALNDPSSMLISKSVAQAFFGTASPINKTIRIDNKLEMKVAGVYDDFSRNSFLYKTEILLPWSNKENWLSGSAMTEWSNHSGQAFVELNDGIDINQAAAKIKGLPTAHITRWKEEATLQLLDERYLHNEFKNGKSVGGRIEFVKLMAIIGIFVLLLACINFMNLSTARSEKRAKEVGIRKAMGSLQNQLIGQFLGESILTAFLAFIFAIGLVQLSLPFFNDLADKQMQLKWVNPEFWLLITGVVLLTGVVAGSYPAFYLSSFQPVRVLKGVFKAGRFAAVPRKVLVVVQFTVSIALVIGTIVVFRQVKHSMNRPVGYKREGLITVPYNSDLWGHLKVLRTDLLNTGVVASMAGSSFSTTAFENSNSIEWPGMDPNKVSFFRDVNVTHDFGKTIGWKIKDGRDFSTEYATDTTAAILNQSAVKEMGLKNPVGTVIKYHDVSYTIVGIVEDMITQSPYEAIQPSVFFCNGWLGVVDIRIKPGVPVGDALAKIGSVYRKLSPNFTFEYKFIDDEYARKFSNEQRVGNLAGFFAVLAIFISCLGLFGLASFIAEQRTKEIGVRKVLGASIFNLWSLLNKEFILLLLIALLVAIPIAHYVMQKWLTNYTYRTDLAWWIFAGAGLVALMITLATVSYQSIKAASANPLKGLRTE